MKKKIETLVQSFNQSPVLKNSLWGIGANVFQNLFLSIFFIIVAREYTTEDFAQYLIASALYQLLAALSTMGLSQWFIREVVNTDDRQALVSRFFKMQLNFGFVFYALNLLLALLIYDATIIHLMAALFGFNIILDNLLYAIKALNVAEQQQKKSSKVLVIESFLLLLSALCIYIYPFSIIALIVIQVVIRFFTINLFLKIGSSSLIDLRSIVRYPVRFADIRKLVYANWAFVIIGSVSLIYWRSANIIISKLLTLDDVAVYGISYKLFQIAIIIPLIISTSVFPSLVKIFNTGSRAELEAFYKKVFTLYLVYGLLSFSFVYSFADYLIPWVFGSTYVTAALNTKQMFLTLLVFPTAILQANMLVAIKLEKFDMSFNVISLVLYLVFTFVGLSFYKSLLVINLSIFASFIIFHLLQDVLLLKKEITTLRHISLFYLLSLACVAGYMMLYNVTNPILSFFITWLAIAIGFLLFVYKRSKKPVQQPV